MEIGVVKDMIQLELILGIVPYRDSLEEWLGSSSELETYFNDYLEVIKPNVHINHQVMTSFDANLFGFYSKILKREQIDRLSTIYNNLVHFELISSQNLSKLQNKHHYSILSQEQFKKMLKLPKTELYRMNLDQQPLNDQYPYWHNHIVVKDVPSFESIVIHGKGIAYKELGFHTANLEFNAEAQSAMKKYPNGIYVVEVVVEKLGKFMGICSIGSNPHFQSTKQTRLVEVHIYNKFEQDFYNSKMSIKFLLLTRLMQKFPNFDTFINGMHNDIASGCFLSKKIDK